MRRNLTRRLERPGLRFGRLSVSSRICLVILALVALAAIFAPVLAQYSPTQTGVSEPTVVDGVGFPFHAPNGDFWFGTDNSGRDIFSRVLYGARGSLVIGLGAVVLALAVAAVLGSIAATSGKVVSEVLMRIMDIIMSFPGIALAAVFVSVFSQSLPSIPLLIITIAFLYVPQLTRVVRANVLEQYGEDYVAAARVMGAPTWWIIIKQVARNAIAPVLVFAAVLVADAIVFEASLSFINAGIKPPSPSWGNILSDGKAIISSGAWWATFFPGVMILITVLCLNVLSEGLTDAMVAPPPRVRIADPAEEVAGDKAAADVAAVDEDDNADSMSIHVIQGGSEADLEARLAQLHRSEIARSDRLVLPADLAASKPVLEVKDLSIAFPQAHGDVDIVDQVSFSVRPGETMGLVGESGCGKSISSFAIMGLLPKSADIRGSILFDGQELLTMNPKQRNSLRGHEMSMIYQDALSALNPSMLVRSQLAQLTKRGGTRSAEDLLELVGLDPVRTLRSYPHELSGGQRQRVLIAMALTRDPQLLIADEPTTALDVTVQQQVVELLKRLQDELGFAMVFVSHDLALVAQLAHRITVMYAGQVVETGTTTEVMSDPRHEYTRGLLGSVLSIEASQGRLHQVPGVVPSPSEFVAGDRFSPRSSHPEIGRDVKATMTTVSGTTHSWAHHPEAEEALR
ncbi:dipeptide/oligopeptide/nickel ABC transporter permease/ATP-binding protein [Cutibacterium sp.]|uniref:dipeptide/oligopeptide/nickel ABC transporter permease/ATP-binding protein n=1 Tax=Cutibacterium sp. TaxID=1912221 RepID=UPI0026DB10C8|nr:dipeptide/oligopeptide/nickel ABC transporter permease/ATP-binding protein [Cutibacterium sp.]MDO4412235.1 dipeptide/oligopeptide/nickel ABC transporter permease/ATP-binding protein [Cutibacterium sp.]